MSGVAGRTRKRVGFSLIPPQSNRQRYHPPSTRCRPSTRSAARQVGAALVGRFNAPRYATDPVEPSKEVIRLSQLVRRGRLTCQRGRGELAIDALSGRRRANLALSDDMYSPAQALHDRCLPGGFDPPASISLQVRIGGGMTQASTGNSLAEGRVHRVRSRRFPLDMFRIINDWPPHVERQTLARP